VSKGVGTALQTQSRRLAVPKITSPPTHPTTCGKVERFPQTLKRFLTKQPKAAGLTDLQTQLDAFVEAYNHRRPHRALPHHATPATTYTARPKADPANRIDTHNRRRRDRIDQPGLITLRLAGRL